MHNHNIEIKASIRESDIIRQILKEENAVFKETDHQCDTYFNVSHGRLKIREGTIENCIVWYERPDIAGPKKCTYHLIEFQQGSHELASLKMLLDASLGIFAEVRKDREIFFIGNIKVHIDTVQALGYFLEIEAIGNSLLTEDDLRSQCDRLLKRFGGSINTFIEKSYADLIFEKNRRNGVSP